MEVEVGPTRRDRQALIDFVVDNADLATLEGLADQFNLFEAINVTRRELTHSNVLAFLLDPRQNHGLGEAFIRGFLQRALLANPDASFPITPIDLDVWSLDQMRIEREWEHIDLTLIDELHRFIVVIENKIGSSEHSNQLVRYRQSVADRFPGLTALFLYLTPDGSAPSDEAYLPVDYGLVAETVEAVAASRGPTLDSAVYVLMDHYARMLRRHVVSDSEIADLCRRIYNKHRRALDLIYEHRPDLQADLQAFLIELIESTPNLIPDDSQKEYVRFALPEWDHESIPRGHCWTNSDRMLLLQFDNIPDGLALEIAVGPGEEADRARLVARARANVPPLGPSFPTSTWRGRRWTRIFWRPFLTATELEELTFEGLTDRVRSEWTRFLESELPGIRDLMLGEEPPDPLKIG